MVARVLAALGLLTGAVLALDCGGYQPPSLGACGDGVPLDEEPCGPDGFVAADRCFGSLQAACGCLGCPSSRCLARESAPAQVTCRPE